MAMHIAESAEEAELVTDGKGDFAEAWKGRGIVVAPRARSPIALLDKVGVRLDSFADSKGKVKELLEPLSL